MLNSTINLTNDFSICRILNGMWQVSGGHGQVNQESALTEMLKYHEMGFTTWDMADIYGPAESIVGEFRRQLKKGKYLANTLQTLTKFVPNPGPMTRSIVEYHIDQSLKKMDVDSIDVVQFHWWDYHNESYLDALNHLSKLCNEGKIRYLGLTNFDSEHVRIIREGGFDIKTHQIQYSILDTRPEKLMIPLCKKYGIQVLAYGTLLGGFLSEKYLDCQQPQKFDLTTLSLKKYYPMIETWGGWELFQELLQTLACIADKHGCSIANVSAKYILEKPQVAGVILGTRLGISEHRKDNSRVFNLTLDSQDYNLINSVLAKSNDLFSIIGDCGNEYH